jgi:hypothetical protein
MHERDCRFFVSRVDRLAEKGIPYSLFCLYIGDNHSHKKESPPTHGLSSSRTARSIR